jgi:TolB protein
LQKGIMKNIFSAFLLLGSILLSATNSNAAISIDITRGNADPMPIALPYLASDSEESRQLGAQIIEVVQNDLEGTALFRSINRQSFLQEIQSGQTLPVFPSWRQINASALITGGIKFSGSDEFGVEFRLWDVFAEQQIAGKSYNTNRKNWRRIAHLISDEIYKRLTGEDGYFDTRVVYVSESGPATKRIKKLAIMDQDGENHRFLTDGSSLVLTPRFSPTAQKVIYMSYSGGTPKVYMLDVDTKEQQLVGDFPGMSFAPRFGSNGNTVVMSASTDGNSEIYSMDINTKNKKRLTTDNAIDTSPSFSPDGKNIVFNSDRGGSQQLYVMDANGNGVKRISFGSGRYGTPVWSPRGDLIAFTKMSGGQFYIGVMRTDGSGERLLTQSFMDEGPTWSPNGRVIMFSRQERSSSNAAGKWMIYSVDLTGYNERRVRTPMEGSDPAWSPLL